MLGLSDCFRHYINNWFLRCFFFVLTNRYPKWFVLSRGSLVLLPCCPYWISNFFEHCGISMLFTFPRGRHYLERKYIQNRPRLNHRTPYCNSDVPFLKKSTDLSFRLLPSLLVLLYKIPRYCLEQNKRPSTLIPRGWWRWWRGGPDLQCNPLYDSLIDICMVKGFQKTKQ